MRLSMSNNKNTGFDLGKWLGEQWNALKTQIKKKQFKHGLLAVILTVIFVAGIILLNVVSMFAVERIPQLSPDLTAGSIYTLSDETVELVRSLDEDVRIYIFASENDCKNPSTDVDPYQHIPMAYELIKRYQQYSDHIQIINIDLATQPGYLDIFSEYRDLLGQYSVAVESHKRTRVTSFYEFLPSLSSTTLTDDTSIDVNSSITETCISSLIKTVTVDVTPKAVYLDGLGGSGEVDYLLNSLYLNGFDLSAIDFRSEDIPSDAQLVIISSPEYDLTLDQCERLENFLLGSEELGKTFLLLSSQYMPSTPNLDALLEDWGIVATRNVVYEGESNYVLAGCDANVFHVQYAEGEYTTDLIDRGLVTVAENALEYKMPTQTKGDFIINPILASSQTGYVRPSTDVSGQFSPAGLTAERRYLMLQSTYYIENPDGSYKRSDIVAAPLSLCYEEYFSSGAYRGNFNLLMNICNYRCGIEEQNINIAAKSLTAVDFAVDSDIIKITTAIFGYIIPLAVLGTGVVVFIRRRRL